MSFIEEYDEAVLLQEPEEIVLSTEAIEPAGRQSVESSEARFRSIFESTTRGLLLLGDDGEPRTANAAFHEMFGIDEQAPLTLELFETRFVSGRQWRELSDRIQACLRGEPRPSDVLTDITRAGISTQRHLLAHCSTLVAAGKSNGVLVEFTEQTEQVHSRRDEGRSRARMEAAQRLAQLGHWEQSLTSGAMHWSDELYRILDLDPELVQPSMERFHEALHPDDRDWVVGVVHDALKTKEGYELRYRIGRADGSVRVVDEIGEISVNDDGKPLRLLGAVHDVTEQVSAQRALTESEARFRTVFATSANGLALIGWDGEIRTANQTFWKIVGGDETQIGTIDSLDLIDESERDELRTAITAEFADRGTPLVELRLRVRRLDDGSERVLRADVAPHVTNGWVDAVLLEVRDITNRVQTRQQLELSTERLSLAQEIAHFGHWDWNLESGEMACSAELHRIFGLPEHGVSPTPELFAASVHPDDRERVAAALERAASESVPLHERHRVVRPDGDIRDVDTVARLLNDVRGATRRLVGTVHDVTDEMARQRALMESEARLSRAQTNSLMAGWEYELSSGAISSSGELARLFEVQGAGTVLTLDAVLGAMHQDDREPLLDAIRAGQQGSGQFELRFRFTGSDAVLRVFWVRGELIRDENGAAVRWDGTVQEITTLAQAEEALAVTTQRLELAQSQASIGSYGRDLVTGEAYWSDEMYRLFGHEPGDLEPTIANMLGFMHEKDRRGFAAAVRAGEHGNGRYDQKNRFVRADGQERVFWQRGELTKTEDGTPLRWDGTCQDVTELVAAQQALAESESQIKLVFDSVSTALAIVGADHRALITNQACSEILGYSAAELKAEPFERFVHPDDLAMVIERFERRLRGEPLQQKQVDTRLIHEDGRVVETDLRAMPFEVAGAVIGVLVEFRDVTAKSALQRQVSASAEQIDAILEATPDALIVADDDDVILRVNAATKSIFGWEPEALVGQPVSVLVGSVDRAMHTEYVDYYKETGRPSTPEGLTVGNFRGATGRRADGSDFPVELAVAETGLSDGRRLFVAAIRDVSERRAAEEQVGLLNAEVARRSQERQALVQQLLRAQEEERRTVAYDIHDGPAQQLAAAQMFLEAFTQDAGIVPSEVPNFAKAKQYLEEGLMETRRIMSGLRPALLDDLGLADALRQLLVELTERVGVQLEFEATRLSNDLPPTIEITLYRVAQEAVANALKHSESNCLEVRLDSDVEGVRLEVRDHGVGFDVDQVRSPSEGKRFGLVGMRERVMLLGGTFEINSSPGAGVTVRATIPFEGGN